MKKVIGSFFIFSFLIMSSLVMAKVDKDEPCNIKNYTCRHSYYHSEFSLLFEKHKRPILVSSWKLSRGNISGRPDYLYTGFTLKPFSKKSSDITQYAMIGDSIGTKYLNIFANEKDLGELTEFEVNDSEPTDVVANPEFRAVCQLKI